MHRQIDRGWRLACISLESGRGARVGRLRIHAASLSNHSRLSIRPFELDIDLQKVEEGQGSPSFSTGSKRRGADRLDRRLAEAGLPFEDLYACEDASGMDHPPQDHAAPMSGRLGFGSVALRGDDGDRAGPADWCAEVVEQQPRQLPVEWRGCRESSTPPAPAGPASTTCCRPSAAWGKSDR